MRLPVQKSGVNSIKIVLGCLTGVNAEKAPEAVTFGIRPDGYWRARLDLGLRTLERRRPEIG